MKTNTNRHFAYRDKLFSIMAVALVVFFAIMGTASAANFEYSGDTGPGFWFETTDWEACGDPTDPDPGARQSPVDITRVCTLFFVSN